MEVGHLASDYWWKHWMPRIVLSLVVWVWFPTFYKSKGLKEVSKSLPVGNLSVNQSPSLFFTSDDSQFGQLEDEDPRTCWRVSKFTVLSGCRKKACRSVSSYWGRNKKENFTVDCIHKAFMDNVYNLPQHWQDGDLCYLSVLGAIDVAPA